MIKVVIFKFKKNAPIEKIKQKIESLKQKIGIIRKIVVGIDIGFNKTLSDLCVISEVENLDDLKIYKIHPEHLNLMWMKKGW